MFVRLVFACILIIIAVVISDTLFGSYVSSPNPVLVKTPYRGVSVTPDSRRGWKIQAWSMKQKKPVGTAFYVKDRPTVTAISSLGVITVYYGGRSKTYRLYGDDQPTAPLENIEEITLAQR
jgi:hypothetical protein